MRTTCGFLLLAAVALPAGAGEVKITVREDGTKVILNEPSESKSRRLAGRLQRPPSTELAQIIEDNAYRVDLDPRLVQAVVQAESGYNPGAVSNKGALGLMQLLPGTARDLAVDDAFDPAQNVRGGTDYLRQMLDRFGALELALAAYNAGPEAVAKYGGIPPYDDTRVYVRRVIQLFSGDDSYDLDGNKVLITRDAKHQIRLTTAGLGNP
jgi:soluble lytic murein transglycosylase-like protein